MSKRHLPYDQKWIKLANSRNGRVGEPANLQRQQRKWSNAIETTVDEIKFPSKVESRVWSILCERFGRENIRRQVRMPLVAGAPKTNGTPLAITVDFAVMDGTQVLHWVDAKTKRRSREWLRGKSLFEATWGPIIETDGSSVDF